MDHFDIKFPASGGRDQWEDFPSGLLAISRGGRILTGEILKRFKKKFSEKSWKFLIEKWFWNFRSKIFRRKKSENFPIQKSMKIKKIGKIEKSKNRIFIDFCIVFFDFPWEKFSIFSPKIFRSKISKSIFDQKFSTFFTDFFINPFKISCRFRISRLEIARRPGRRGFSGLSEIQKKVLLFCTFWPFLRSEICESALK